MDRVNYNGGEVGPSKFLKALRPAPSALGPLTKGKTCIGCRMKGGKNGKGRTAVFYNICDHEEAYREVKSQAISYTTGVPAMIGGLLMLTGEWSGKGVFNMEQMDPDPFMARMNKHGLPWSEIITEDK